MGEVVIIDDGSSDDTVAVAERWISERGLNAAILRRPADAPKGVSTCRNLGLAAARGEWIAFLDSDDLFAPQKLERVSQAIDRWGDRASPNSTCEASSACTTRLMGSRRMRVRR